MGADFTFYTELCFCLSFDCFYIFVWSLKKSLTQLLRQKNRKTHWLQRLRVISRHWKCPTSFIKPMDTGSKGALKGKPNNSHIAATDTIVELCQDKKAKVTDAFLITKRETVIHFFPSTKKGLSHLFDKNHRCGRPWGYPCRFPVIKQKSCTIPTKIKMPPRLPNIPIRECPMGFISSLKAKSINQNTYPTTAIRLHFTAPSVPL